MSGHSKWAKIHRQKGVTDQKKGQLFSKLARAITIAARDGLDPEANFKLRLAVEKARQANMPKGNIERALRSAQGKLGGGGLEEAVYEGYGPGRIALVIETVTDNRNRTTAEIKNLFEKRGGNLGGPGSVSFQFKKAGLLTVEKGFSSEKRILKIIDLGVEDVEEVEDAIEVYVKPEKLDETKKKLEANDFKVIEAELVMKPIVFVKLTDKEKAKKVLDFMEELEDHGDVQRVFTNFDIPDEFLEPKRKEE